MKVRGDQAKKDLLCDHAALDGPHAVSRDLMKYKRHATAVVAAVDHVKRTLVKAGATFKQTPGVLFDASKFGSRDGVGELPRSFHLLLPSGPLGLVLRSWVPAWTPGLVSFPPPSHLLPGVGASHLGVLRPGDLSSVPLLRPPVPLLSGLGNSGFLSFFSFDLDSAALVGGCLGPGVSRSLHLF